jgi:uncharacterized protein (DUF1697 family)
MGTVVSHTGKYVALLRGINVGSAKRIAMADLRAVFEGLGYREVRTVLQSGNVVFDAPEADATSSAPRGVTARLVEDSIADATGVRAATIVLPAERFLAILRDNPLVDIPDPSRMIITFCDEPPRATDAERPSDAELAPERIEVGRDALYQWLPDGVLKTKLPARYTEAFAASCTARNLRTATKIAALLESADG